MPGEQAVWDRLTHWLHAQGFALSLWGAPCLPAVPLAMVAAHHYLRAERLDADGRRLQVDLQLPMDEPAQP